MSIDATQVADMVAAVGATEAAAAAARTQAVDALRSRIEEAIASRDSAWEASNAEIETLRAQFRSLGGVFTRKARTPKNEGAETSNGTLLEAVARAVHASDTPMSPTQVCEAVRAAGYQSDAENFNTMVSGALTNLKKASKGRGKNKEFIVNNETRGLWAAGSGMKAYLKSLEADPQA